MTNLVDSRQPLSVPKRSLGILGTTPPTTEGQAMGRIGQSGLLMVETNAGVSTVVTMMVWSPMQKTWITPGTNTSQYQKTYTAPSRDFMAGAVGEKFFIYAASALTAWVGGDDPV